MVKKTRLRRLGERIGLGIRYGAGGEDLLSVTDMPSGVGITKQQLHARERGDAVDHRDDRQDEGNIRNQPPTNQVRQTIRVRSVTAGCR